MFANLIPVFATAAIALAFGSVGGWVIGFAIGALGFLLCAFSLVRRLHRVETFAGNTTAQTEESSDGLVKQLASRERALRESALQAVAQRESVQLAVRALPDAVVVLDAAQRVVWCNDAANTLLGLSNTVEGRMPISHWLRDHAFLEFLHNPKDSAVALTSPLDPNRMLALSTVRCDVDTRVLIARDITEVKRVEAMRRDFIADLSHELKTPLTVVVGFSETLLSDTRLPEGQVQRALEHIKTQADNMQRLVQELLLLSRLESTSAQADKRPVELSLLVARCVEHNRLLAGTQQRISFPGSKALLVLGQEEELESALNNLLTNALKYSREDGVIEVSIERGAAQCARVMVKDNGQGIAPEHLPRLTERFYRVDRGRSRAAGGTGLGLAIVKHIMNRHGGKLHIASELGSGSTFTLEFPEERIRSSTND